VDGRPGGQLEIAEAFFAMEFSGLDLGEIEVLDLP
jgi:hypothetical protein